MLGRLGRFAAAGLILALFLAGCGEQKKNEARAPTPVQTTVKVTDERVVVSPSSFNVTEPTSVRQAQSAPAAEAEQRGETISTPEQAEPPTKLDQAVEITIINLSDQDLHLEVTGPGTDATSKLVPAQGTGLMKVTLPTGTYTLRARGDFRPDPATLRMGPLRASAQGDLLVP